VLTAQGKAGALVVEGLLGELDQSEAAALVVGVAGRAGVATLGVEAGPGGDLLLDTLVARHASGSA
jgi:hypothetical protein